VWWYFGYTHYVSRTCTDRRSPVAGSKFNASKIADWAFKILSAIVIPLFIWGITLQSKVSLQAKDIETLQTALKTKVSEAKELKTAVDSNSKSLVRMEEKINGAVKVLDEISGDIKDLWKSGNSNP